MYKTTILARSTTPLIATIHASITKSSSILTSSLGIYILSKSICKVFCSSKGRTSKPSRTPSSLITSTFCVCETTRGIPTTPSLKCLLRITSAKEIQEITTLTSLLATNSICTTKDTKLARSWSYYILQPTWIRIEERWNLVG